jgi:hypothetical protein
MFFTPEQQEEILHFLNLPEINQLIREAQYCLWIKNVSTKTLKKTLFQKIRDIKNTQKIKLSQQVHTQLDAIVAQIIDTLPHTRMRVIHNFSAFYLEERSKNLDADSSIFEALQAYISKAYLHIGMQQNSPQEIQLDLTQEAQDILDALKKNDIEHYMFSMRYKILAGILMLYRFSRYKETEEINIEKILLVIFFSYFFSAHLVPFTYNVFKKPYKEKAQQGEGEALFSIEQVHILGAKNKIAGITYLPCYRPPEKITSVVSEEKEISAAEDEKEDAPTPVLKKVKTRSPVSFFSSLYSAPSSTEIVWPSKYLSYGAKEGVITQQQVHEMRAPYFSKHTHFYAFFNTSALRAQGIKKESEEFKTYAEILEREKVVGPKGQTGIKNLNPSVLIPTENKDALVHYLWSAKKLGELYRLLGRNAHTLLSKTGERRTLVDFDHHMPLGPGKGPGQ